MRISDWSSAVCSSDLFVIVEFDVDVVAAADDQSVQPGDRHVLAGVDMDAARAGAPQGEAVQRGHDPAPATRAGDSDQRFILHPCSQILDSSVQSRGRSEEHTSELQSLMRNSYAVL